MEFLYLIFHTCLRLRFLDVETNPGPRRPVPDVGRILMFEGWRHTYEMVYGALLQPKFECFCCEMLVFTVCGVRQNIYVYSLYCNPDLDDQNFDCILASMAAVQAEDVLASFLFVGVLNSHHQEWMGSTSTNRHGVAAFDFATVLRSVGCRPKTCTWCNTWPPDNWCSWLITGCCCSTDR